MQGNRRFFSVTAIFSGHFLTNMPKFQKFHFFLRRIYIIIEGRTEPRNVFRGVIPAVMAQETPPKRFRKPKRYRERCQIPARCRTNGLAPYRYRKKGENTMVNKVRVNIAGTPYAIATTDSEKYILGLAKKLDEDITKLLDTNDNLSVTKAAGSCRPAGAAGQGAPARDPPGGARRPRCGRDCTGAARPGSPGGRQCADRRDQLNVPYINRSQKENYGKDRDLSPGGQ